MDEEKIRELIAGFTTLNGYIRETWKKVADSVAAIRKNGEEVPPELYQAVAEVLAFVYNLRGNK